MNLKTVPVVGFFIRFPAMLIATIVAVWISMNSTVFEWVGVFFNIISIPFLVMVAVILIRHLFWRKSIDEFVANGGFKSAWDHLSAEKRLHWTLAVTCLLILCFSIIAASLAK